MTVRNEAGVIWSAASTDLYDAYDRFFMGFKKLSEMDYNELSKELDSGNITLGEFDAEFLKRFSGVDGNLTSTNGIDDPEPPKAKCDHKWKHYHGLIDIYEYCETCGAKKEAL